MGVIESTDTKLGSWQAVGSGLTFVLLLIYIAVVTLKFQIPQLLVRVQVILFVLLCVRVLGGLRFIRMTRTQFLTVIILVLTLCATIAGQYVSEQMSNLRMIPQVSRFLVIAVVGALELNSVERLRTVLAWTAAVATTVALLTIISVFLTLPFAFTGPIRNFGLLPLSLPRSLGIWMSFGSYGVLAVVGLSYASVIMIWPTAFQDDGGEWYRQILAGATVGIILVGIYLGKSRSTWLAVAAIFGWFLIVAAFHPDTRFRATIPEIPRLILLLGVLGITVALKSTLGVFFTGNTESVSSRTEQYRLALELLAERPFLGWGWDYFGVVFGPQFTVHNLWFLVGVSLGVPILLLWIYMFARLGIDIFRRNRAGDGPGRALAVVGTGMFLGGLVELALYPGFTPVTAVLIGLLVGIAGVSGTGR